jgi:hypothetical protein
MVSPRTGSSGGPHAGIRAELAPWQLSKQGSEVERPLRATSTDRTSRE